MKKNHEKKKGAGFRCAALAAALCAFISAGCRTAPDDHMLDGDGMEKTFFTIDAEAAKQMMDREEVIIVDVRTIQEYSEKHIPGALNIPLDSIGEEIPEQLEGTDLPILLYCRTGVRSREAAQKLLRIGCERLYDFGGIESWPYETVSSADEKAAAGPALMLDHHEQTDTDGILFEVTGFDDSVLTAVITNQSGQEFEYGEPFEVKVKKDGVWTDTGWMADTMWIMIAYVLPPGESAEVKCGLAHVETIESGEYMLVKSGLETPFSLVYGE